MPPSSYVSVRRSIRWLPGEAMEPTHTIVLTEGKTGAFLDVRFLKDSSDLEWAFAGYRHKISEDTVKFTHHIDSRTLTPLEVKDIGKNISLENGQTLESGEMVNPETGQMTAYEEIWEDIQVVQHEESASTKSNIFIKNIGGTKWQAVVENWQLALGRDQDGVFWAWQAVKVSETGNEEKKVWKVIYSSPAGQRKIVFLPKETEIWRKESVEWNNDFWQFV
ncbi:hypothetical protein GALMADRAFT_71257 [Galerina marginata CBS 339.88]|uniref:Protein HRI1 n=1 Tax=Galerina marginata (strain CBS 339.88) TaxID=685588 RepID=A0A067T559_GALM3|nr:hypothetical protein GALMADRAFT_71257 [Galerina marginata CBS 339.88]